MTPAAPLPTKTFVPIPPAAAKMLARTPAEKVPVTVSFDGETLSVGALAMPDALRNAPLPAHIAVWNHLIPKHALGRTVHRAADRSLTYRHATKGARRISARRLAILGL